MKVDIARLRELLEKGTPRPWRIRQGGGHKSPSICGSESIHTNGRLRNRQGISSAGYSNEVCEIGGWLELDGVKANTALICEAVNALPALLQAWEVVEEAACGLCSKVSPGREAQITCIGYEPDRPEMWCLACKASAALAKLEERA